MPPREMIPPAIQTEVVEVTETHDLAMLNKYRTVVTQQRAPTQPVEPLRIQKNDN